MIPANIHPLMMAGGGDPLDEFGKILNSVRFNAADSPHFTRTNGVPTDQTRWTLYASIRRTAFDAASIISGKSGTTTAWLGFAATGALSYNGLVDTIGSSQGSVASNALFRDAAEFLAVTYDYDASRPAGSRIKMFLEDVELPVTLTVNIGVCNLNTSGATLKLGGQQYGAATYSNQNVAWVRFIDGQTLGPSPRGRRHPRTNQWRDTPYAGTYGNNGFFLDFSDGSAATSGALGKDRSGNNNDFTPVNISVAAGAGQDWLLDSPTNTFCTLNPLQAGIAPFNGNLQMVGASAHRNALGTMRIPSSGYVYFEGTVAAINQRISLGVATEALSLSAHAGQAPFIGMYGDSTNVQAWFNGVVLFSLVPVAASDVFQIAINANTGEGWLGRNNTYYSSTGAPTGNPATGANPTFTGITSGYLPELGIYDPTNAATINFGQRAFAHTPPWLKAELCTKNLPIKPAGPMKSTDAFVAVTDSGANIVATLAAAAPWADWIKIYKRRDPTAEGWRWQFSDDPGNYLDSSSTAEKAAFPALAGTSYIAAALKVSAATGVATGTFAHVNGVPSVVTDGLGNTRKMIVLKRESAAGDNWPTYHPDLTAGKLLYLNTTAAETTDASISSVTASGFTAAAALPTGTYRWIALAEVDGGIKLGKYTANGTTDNAFAGNALSPLMSFIKNTGAATNWVLHDAARNSYNPATAALHPNTTGGDDIGNSSIDLLSNGFKVRAVDGSVGTNAVAYVYMSIAAFPFRYANAR